jgi:hypothetical protein
MLDDDVFPVVIGLVAVLAVCWLWDWYQVQRDKNVSKTDTTD